MSTSFLAPTLTRAYLKTVWATLPPHLRPPLLLPTPTLSARLGCTLTLASETFQIAFALNLKVEPTGALALGAILAHPARFVGKSVCCVLSGGNVDPEVYAQVIQEEKQLAVASFPEMARQ